MSSEPTRIVIFDTTLRDGEQAPGFSMDVPSKLAMARAIALPARYVCGYVFDAKRGDVIGSHASHAWCELWVPGYGWLGVDPTNKRVVHEAYVASAVGRDYRDATPVSGTYWGSGDREMRVTVHVESK